MSKIEELEKQIQDLTAQYEKKVYDLEQLLEISRSLCSTLESSKLFESITYTCMAQVHVINAGVFMIDGLTSDPVVKILLEEKKPLTLDIFEKKCPESAALKILQSLNTTLVVPLIQKNHINGILFLGERLVFDTESDYTDAEKKQIMEISSLASLAINNATLLERSSTDMMTKLKLKFFFFNILADKLDNALAQKTPLSVIMFDIDFFKHFNDTYGHECGDYVLKEVATLIKSSLREEDLASRYGGEEFTILLDHTDKEQAMNVAERIRTNIENHDFIFADQRMKVTISGGVAVFNHETNPVMVPKDLVNQADQGLYMSKHNGRNRITYAPPSLVALDGLNN